MSGIVGHYTSNMVAWDSATKALLKNFTKAAPVADEEFVEMEIVISKENNRSMGTKKYSKLYQLITKVIEKKLGDALYFVVRSQDDELDPGNTTYQNIQGWFVENYSKLMVPKKHCVKYDQMDMLMIPKCWSSGFQSII